MCFVFRPESSIILELFNTEGKLVCLFIVQIYLIILIHSITQSKYHRGKPTTLNNILYKF